MTLHCSKCNVSATSLIITPELAFKEVYLKLSEHYVRDHRESSGLLRATLAKMTVELSMYMSMRECIIIPDDETWVLGEMEKVQDSIMRVLGFDPEISEEIVDEKVEEKVQ